jgi:hypothetical protein
MYLGKYIKKYKPKPPIIYSKARKRANHIVQEVHRRYLTGCDVGRHP